MQTFAPNGKHSIRQTGCASRYFARYKLLCERHGLPCWTAKHTRIGPTRIQLEGIALILAVVGDIGFDEFEHLRPDLHGGLEYLACTLQADRLGHEAQDALRILPVRFGLEVIRHPAAVFRQ